MARRAQCAIIIERNFSVPRPLIGAAVALSFCSLAVPAAFARGGHGGGHGGGGHLAGAGILAAGILAAAILAARISAVTLAGATSAAATSVGAISAPRILTGMASQPGISNRGTSRCTPMPTDHFDRHGRLSDHAIANERLAHFHGFHGFERHGFNRNAFGGMGQWDHWARDHWGAGWNQWGSGWGYWSGPVFWPYLYGDALSFALWPDDVYDPFFGYGPDYLLSSIFWPGPVADGYAPIFDVYGAPSRGDKLLRLLPSPASGGSGRRGAKSGDLQRPRAGHHRSAARPDRKRDQADRSAAENSHRSANRFDQGRRHFVGLMSERGSADARRPALRRLQTSARDERSDRHNSRPADRARQFARRSRKENVSHRLAAAAAIAMPASP